MEVMRMGCMTRSSRYWPDRGICERSLIEPVLETDPAKARVFAGGQRLIVDGGAEVAGMNVGDHLAAIALRGQKLPGDLVERNRLGAGNFNRAVDRRSYSNVRQSSGDVFRG